MKKLLMVLAFGLALSSVGFARDRDVRVITRGHERAGVVLGYSYAPAPGYYAPAPVYCPPVVGGVVVRRDFDRDHRLDRDRDRDRHDRDDRRGFRR
jgi:hypothetical protein